MQTKWLLLLVAIGCPGLGWAKSPTAPTPRAIEHNNRGAQLLNEGRLERAEIELKTAVELSPDYAEAYSNLGILYKKRDQLDIAMQHFQKAIAIDRDYASAYNHIAAIQITQGRYNDAIQSANRALKKEPTFADAVYNKGLALFLKGQAQTNMNARRALYEEAEKAFSKATQLHPKLTIAHRNMGDLYTELGRYELAAIRYQLALEDEPTSLDTWRQLANVYRLMGDEAKARNAENQAGVMGKRKQSEDAFATGAKAIGEAENKWAAGDKKGASPLYNTAIKAFAEALLANPQSIEAAYQLGVAYQRQGATPMARKAWKQTLNIQPDHAGALYNLGTLEFLEGNRSDGTHYFCRFLRIAGRTLPAEAQIVREQLRAQGMTCPN